MGAIKDLTDLTIKLLEMKEAQRFATEIIKIQALVASLQAEHAEIMDRDFKLREENSDLKRKLEEATAEDVRIYHGVELRKGKRTSGKWAAFCPKCHMPAESSGVAAAQCSVCCGWSANLPNPLDYLMERFKE
jgi:hypothetical protein